MSAVKPVTIHTTREGAESIRAALANAVTATAAPNLFDVDDGERAERESALRALEAVQKDVHAGIAAS